jgi:hypothetical protein
MRTFGAGPTPRHFYRENFAMKKAIETVGKPVPGRWKKEIQPHGTLHGPASMFLTTGCGTATGGGEKYELLCAGWGAGPPMIRCERTRLTFTLSWEDVLNMAIAAGIAKEHPEMRD